MGGGLGAMVFDIDAGGKCMFHLWVFTHTKFCLCVWFYEDDCHMYIYLYIVYIDTLVDRLVAREFSHQRSHVGNIRVALVQGIVFHISW